MIPNKIAIITAEINEGIRPSLLEYQKKGDVTNIQMYEALKEIANSFLRQDFLEKEKRRYT